MLYDIEMLYGWHADRAGPVDQPRLLRRRGWPADHNCDADPKGCATSLTVQDPRTAGYHIGTAR